MREFSFLTLTLGVVAAFCVLCVILSVSACTLTPRSEAHCLKNNVWVQCENQKAQR